MKSEWEEGDELLRTVQSCVSSILPTLNPSGQSCIQSDVQTLVSSMAGLRSQLDAALTVNERSHSLWCQYDVDCNAFTSWIMSKSDELQNEPQKRTRLEDKKTALDIQQVRIT